MGSYLLVLDCIMTEIESGDISVKNKTAETAENAASADKGGDECRFSKPVCIGGSIVGGVIIFVVGLVIGLAISGSSESETVTETPTVTEEVKPADSTADLIDADAE